VTCPYQMMQRAVDIVNSSPHPTNKIAATLHGTEANGHSFTISETNYWPAPIESKIGRETKIGNSSGTIHAETACILHAPSTKNAELFITDPPCPNCSKNMAEAGIKALYIDHKGFDKDFAQRRGDLFASMSMRILGAAGIEVYVVYRKDRKIETALDIQDGYVPPEENPSRLSALNSALSKALFLQQIEEAKTLYQSAPFALALGEQGTGNTVAFSASSHPAIGYTHEDDLSREGKYSFILQPINRILMGAKSHGLKIDPRYIYSSRTPTARELINMVGANFTALSIGDKAAARDEFGQLAMQQLGNAAILQFN